MVRSKDSIQRRFHSFFFLVFCRDSRKRNSLRRWAADVFGAARTRPPILNCKDREFWADAESNGKSNIVNFYQESTHAVSEAASFFVNCTLSVSISNIQYKSPWWSLSLPFLLFSLRPPPLPLSNKRVCINWSSLEFCWENSRPYALHQIPEVQARKWST